jgi:DNA polymerase III epsilon subunit-like protein
MEEERQLESVASPPKRARTVSSDTTCRIFYDCETSGKGCPKFKQHRIIELAAVAAYAPGNALATKGLGRRRHGVLPDGFFSEFVSGGPCAPRATAVHGLSDEDLLDARPFEAVWQSFVAFAHDAQERQPHCTAVSLVGHNSLFADNYWLLSELARCGRKVQELALPGRHVVFEDTYPKSEDVRRRLRAELALRSLKNSELHRSLWPEQGSGTEEAHTALWDAAATRDNWGHIRVRQSAERLSAAQQECHWKSLQER